MGMITTEPISPEELAEHVRHCMREMRMATPDRAAEMLELHRELYEQARATAEDAQKRLDLARRRMARSGAVIAAMSAEDGAA